MAVRDGGSLKAAKVNKEGNLHVRALILPHIAHHSKNPVHENSFVLYGKHIFQVADTDENAFYFQYTGNDFCVLNQIIVATNCEDVSVELFFDSVYTSGGVDKTVLNLNRKSAKSIDYVAKDSNDGATPLVMTNPSTNEFNHIQLSSGLPSYTIDFEDAIFFRKNSSLGVVVKSTLTNKKFRTSLYFYEDDPET